MAKQLKEKELKKVSGGDAQILYYFRLHNLDKDTFSPWSSTGYSTYSLAKLAGNKEISRSPAGRYEVCIKGEQVQGTNTLS